MVTIALPIALGLIMLGLGLSLTTDDFARVAKHPKAVAIALVCQILVLPVICFGLVQLFDLPPILAVGMMLLAASPGGTTANLYSHLFRGDVALNISLTAINSVLAVFTLPIVVNLAIAYFVPDGDRVGLQFQKTLEVFAIVLLPVVIGMLIRRWRPAFAQRMDKPVRIGSAVILALVIVGAVISNLEILRDELRVAGRHHDAVLRAEPHYRVRRAADVPGDRGRVHRDLLRGRHPQRDPGDRRGPVRAAEHRDVPAGGDLRGADVLHRGSVRLPDQATGGERGGGRERLIPAADSATAGRRAVRRSRLARGTIGRPIHDRRSRLPGVLVIHIAERVSGQVAAGLAPLFLHCGWGGRPRAAPASWCATPRPCVAHQCGVPLDGIERLAVLRQI